MTEGTGDVTTDQEMFEISIDIFLYFMSWWMIGGANLSRLCLYRNYMRNFTLLFEIIVQ
jgi:hypothetical protein